MATERADARHDYQELEGGQHPECTCHACRHRGAMAGVDSAHPEEVDEVHRHPRCLRSRPQPRRHLHSGGYALSAAHQPCCIVQHRAGAHRGRDYGLRKPRCQLPVGVQPCGRPRPRPALAAHLRELRRGCHRQCPHGGSRDSRLSGRRPQPPGPLQRGHEHEALLRLRCSLERQGPHTGLRVAADAAREVLRALQGCCAGRNADDDGELGLHQRPASARQL